MLGTLLASGMTFWIGIEALINMAVMVGLMPFAGNALPFISAGGSNLVSTLVRDWHYVEHLPPERRECQRRKKMIGGHSVRLLICAGGTGGGVYPALAVHSALTAKVHGRGHAVGGRRRWHGGISGETPGYSLPVHPRCRCAWCWSGWFCRGILPCLARGVLAARRILNEFKPDVLFFTGGYVAVPMALAGRSIPSLLYVPDIEPGMALKSLARFADVIAVTTEQSQKFFNKQVYETGYPLRPDLALWDRQTAHQHLGISGKLPVLLVFGGSKGARSINMAVLNNLRALLEKFEIIHISGELDWQIVKEPA